MTVCFMDPGKAERVREVINGDPEFRLAARFFSRDVLIKVGDSKCILKIRDGVLSEIRQGPAFTDTWSILIGAPSESWEKFLRPCPPPFFTDLYGGVARQHFELGGDVEAVFAHYWAITRMLDIVRQVEHEQ